MARKRHSPESGMRSQQDVMSYGRIMSAGDGDTLFDRFAHVGLAAKP